MVLIQVERTVKAALAVNKIVTATAFKRLRGIGGVVTAPECVSEFGTTNLVDAAQKDIMPDRRVSVRRPRRKVDRHGTGRVQVRDAGVAIAANNVVAVSTLELVRRAVRIETQDTAGILAQCAEAGCIESIGKSGAGNKFDRTQRIGACYGRFCRVCELCNITGRKINGNRTAGSRVIGAVDPRLAVKQIASATRLECVVKVSPAERIVPGVANEIKRPVRRKRIKLVLVNLGLRHRSRIKACGINPAGKFGEQCRRVVRELLERKDGAGNQGVSGPISKTAPLKDEIAVCR